LKAEKVNQDVVQNQPPVATCFCLYCFLGIGQSIGEGDMSLSEAVILRLVGCCGHSHTLGNGLVCLRTEHNEGHHIHAVPIQVFIFEGRNPCQHSSQILKGLATPLNCVPGLSVLQQLDPSLKLQQCSIRVLELLLKPCQSSTQPRELIGCVGRQRRHHSRVQVGLNHKSGRYQLINNLPH
jgi:hypothetical protein